MINYCECGCGQEVPNKLNCYGKQIRFIRFHYSRKGSKLSDETKIKISNSLKNSIKHQTIMKSAEYRKNVSNGVRNSQKYRTAMQNVEYRKRISLRLKGKVGMIHTEESRKKISEGHKKNISIDDIKLFLVNIFKYNKKVGKSDFWIMHLHMKKNKYAKFGSSVVKRLLKENNLVLENIVNELGLKFESQFIRNGIHEQEILDSYEKYLGEKIERNYYVSIDKYKKFYVDGYVPKLNLVIEVDEYHHFQSTGELKIEDKIRQSLIEKKFGCEFVRIKDDII